MTDANGWPEEARKAVARLTHEARFKRVGREPQEPDRSDKEYCAFLADAALAALAPYHSAALAAQAVAMREALQKDIASRIHAARKERRRLGNTTEGPGALCLARINALSRALDGLLALPIPHEPALAALLAAERAAGVREGMEKAAGIARDYECSHPHLPDAIARAITAALKDQPA